MALKYIVKKEEYDALAEPLRALYTEKDGKYTLGVEGVSPESEVLDLKTKLGEFRDNNRSLHAENEKLKPVVDKVKKVAGDDIDTFLTEHTTLKTRVKALDDKGITKPDDIAAAIENALKPVKDALAAEQSARAAAQKAADHARFRELVSAEATKAGVRPQSMRHALRDAEDIFDLKDGKLTPKSGIKHPDDPLKDMTPDAWLAHLAKTDAYLFADNGGGGAQSSTGQRTGGIGKPGARELINPTPEEKGRFMKEIAEGSVVVVQR